ncbi:myc box-dependent-interacting protein 1b isoform X2 [Archocentrus centrarchus]|uniref:myc box-dependent-interacting protein 1b isoform X2 n=1 Tax=Archocentrus centrarchus TaxID=63155 RepID=UPI0011EA43D3|nr:myc box-dependent-interacting protein 1-like isoform X2 [Archocentrus centrarchus]
MAEIGKGVTAGKLASNVQKRLTRAQEKVLQKLGKADETRDAVFEEMVTNFNKQMTEGTKLQKDLKAYVAAVKTMHDASRRLQDCLADMYEPDWFGKEEMDSLAEEMIEKELDSNLEDTDSLWLEYHQNITEKSLQSMDTYLSQFPDIKARIAKRDRKMVDFDSARHHFASLQKGKKKDEAKIAKPAALLEMAAPSWAQGLISAHQVAQTNLSYNQAEEDLGRAQKIFEELNVELQDELPALWDRRVGIYVNAFQSLAGHQEKFHKEQSKLSQNLNDIMTKLEEQRQINEGANHSESASSAPKRPGPPPPRLTPSPSQQQNVSPFEDEPSMHDTNTDSTTTSPQAPSWDSWQEQTATEQEQECDDDQYPEEARGGWDYSQSNTQSYTQPSWDEAETAAGEEGWSNDAGYTSQSYTEPNWDNDGADVGQGGWGDDEYTQSAVTNGSDGELPPGFLYKVKAIHDYAATDGDELELKMGDVVLVLAFDNPDEQDDGWLMGVKESQWSQKKDISAKGVFPENFTQRV